MSNNTPSIDSMLGIISNANQTASILESQRSTANNLISTMERNLDSLSKLSMNESDKLGNITDRNNAFLNQNLNNLGTTVKDNLQHGFAADLVAIERNGAGNLTAVDRVGNAVMSAVERNGNINSSATERNGGTVLSAVDRNGAANLIAAERIGSANISSLERIGSTLGMLGEKTNSVIANGFKDTAVSSERNFGETRLFNAQQFQNIERRAGDYYVQTEKNFGNIQNDLVRVENSLGRLSDTHHNATMIELLKTHAALDKSIDRNELNLTKQAAENYANVQIDAAKNRLSIEQKISDMGNDIKFTLLKDNNETRNILNKNYSESLRDGLNSEKIIHALHHHGHHDHYDHHHGHHHRHHGYDDANVIYDYRHNYGNRYDSRSPRRGRGGRGDGDGGGRGD